MIALDARHRLWLQTWGTSLALLPVCVVFALEGGGFWLGEALWLLVDAASLIVHEAGHFFFRFFGRFLMIAGGTILQLGLPALLVFQGVYWNNKLGTQLALLWLGQGFVDVSIYAADAQARSLPLIGNLGPESHDWGNMLTMLGWLDYTPLIAGAFYACAFVCWAVMLAVPWRIS
ncbi:MAG: hypothetical protein AAGI91_14220 [Bacteroidota bacterium]